MAKSLPNEEKNKKKRFLWLWLSLLLLVGILGGTYLYLNQSSEPKQQIVSGEFLPKQKDAKEMSEEELAKYAQKTADESQFQLVINPKSTINYDTQSGYIGIKNPKNNAYPINVTLYDTATNKEIYSSGAISPGQEITNGKLTKKLEKETYEVKARFDIFDKDTNIKRGQQSAIITMTVQ
jgi:exopolysaccharide biosynthesis protein